MSEIHHHAHGPANRGRIVHTTAAPLFVSGSGHPIAGAVMALHGVHGIDARFEAGIRHLASRGLLVVAPYLYFREGGPDHPEPERARAAFALLTVDGLDTDVDAAITHLTRRHGVPAARIRLLGCGGGIEPARRGAARHGLGPPVELMPETDQGPLPSPGWRAAAELLTPSGAAAPG